MAKLAAIFAALIVAATMLVPPVFAQEAAPDEVVVFVLDLSGSMNEPFDTAQTKLDVAKEAFAEAFGNVPPDALVGLRVYGDQNASTPADERSANCSSDSRVAVPVSPVQRESLISEVRGFSARGDTAISLALENAAQDIPAGAVGTIVLFSDGRDECFDADLDGDSATGPSYGSEPCSVAADLAQGEAVDRVVTVGFRADTAAEAELRCIASATGGTYTAIETPEDAQQVLPDLLVELSSARAGILLGETAIVGSADQNGAPVLPRLDASDAGNGIYTDTLSINSGKWYHLPEFGKGATTLTATVFGLPATPGITFNMALYRPDTDTYLFTDRIDENAGLPERSTASIRCGECRLEGGPHDVYWIVALSSTDPSVTGTYDLEIQTEGLGYGGREPGCHEPQECWYGPEIEERQALLRDLLEQVGAKQQGLAPQALVDQRDGFRRLSDEATAANEALVAQAVRYEDVLAAAPPRGKSFRMPLLLIVGGLVLAFAPLSRFKRAGEDDEVATKPEPLTEEEAKKKAKAEKRAAKKKFAQAAVDAARAGIAKDEKPVNKSADVLEKAKASILDHGADEEPESMILDYSNGQAVERDAAAYVDSVAAETAKAEAAKAEAPRASVSQAVAAKAAAVKAEAARALPTSVVKAKTVQTETAQTETVQTETVQAATQDGAPAPGWYADPLEPGKFRWWDGAGWTGSTSLHADAGRPQDEKSPL